jgi:hypothetical protein
MKKRAAVPLVFLLLSGLCCYFAAASGGDSADPLVSLSYLNGTFTAQVQDRLARDPGGVSSGADAPSAPDWTEVRLKSGDKLTGSQGTEVLPLAGQLRLSIAAGAVIDVTAGRELASGEDLLPRHRYLVGENSTAEVLVGGKTAVLDYRGPYALAYSSALDYTAAAQGLKALHLFRGSLTGYGQGLDLEASPTRLQALIMFLRLLGQEEAALAYTGGTPFTDIQPGSEAAGYVGYAYAQGYTNGYTKTTFRPGEKVNANQYAEFVLRALGYSSTATTDLSDALDRAVSAGVFSGAERETLAAGPFLRADLVLISWKALGAKLFDSGETLQKSLLSRGIFTQDEWNYAVSHFPDPTGA